MDTSSPDLPARLRIRGAHMTESSPVILIIFLELAMVGRVVPEMRADREGSGASNIWVNSGLEAEIGTRRSTGRNTAVWLLACESVSFATLRQSSLSYLGVSVIELPDTGQSPRTAWGRRSLFALRVFRKLSL